MKSKNSLVFLIHGLLVFSAGVVLAYFAQVLKSLWEVDVLWSSRFVFLSISFGFATCLLWHVVSGLYARLRKSDRSLTLQADAYSYISFLPLLSYQYLQHDIQLKSFLGIFLAYVVFFKIAFLLLANTGKLPAFLRFSVQGRENWKPFLLVGIILPSFYLHQISLAAYTVSTEQERRLKMGHETRSGFVRPWGKTNSYQLDATNNAVLCLAYGFTEEMLAAKGKISFPRHLKITVRNDSADQEKRFSFPIDFVEGWHECGIDLAAEGIAAGRIMVSAGTSKYASWLWTNPVSKPLALANPFVIRKRTAEPNIILISVDALRPDFIHSLGSQRPTTPAIDSLVRDGFSFPLTVSPGTWTKPANIAMMTSLYSERNVIDVEMERFPHRTLIEELADHNYVTLAATDGGWVSSETAFFNGFRAFGENICTRWTCNARVNFEMAREFIDAWKAYPLFLWIYTDEVHNPTWHPVPEWGECPRDQTKLVEEYHSAVASFDRSLEAFLDFLKKSGSYDDTIIILTADHGNAFGEIHNNNAYVPCGHGGIPYNEQALIPLVIKPQRKLNAPAGRIIREYVSGIDIAPTILDLAGLEIPKQYEGISLLPAVFGDSLPKDREIFCSQGQHQKYSIAMFKGNRKLLYPRRGFPDKIRLYDLLHDPKEQADIADSDPLTKELVAIMEDHLVQADEFLAQTQKSQPVRFSPELSGQLRSLGYIQ